VKKLGLIAIGALIGALSCFFVTGKAKVEELVLISFGALIGAILSFFATEISAWRRQKKDEREKEIEIVSSVANFAFKAFQIIDDSIEKEIRFLKRKDRDPNAKNKHREYLEKLSEGLSTFAVEEDYHTFQLRRVGNLKILKKFKNLLDQFKYYDLLSAEDKKQIDALEKKRAASRKLLEEFMSDCVEFCRIRTTKRTLSAPKKKKDPAKKS
jgi:hypothetical protein